MAGKPKMRKLEAHIEKHGGDPFILEQIADGNSITKIAKGILLNGKEPVSRSMLFAWRKRGGEDRLTGWQLALEASGHALAEDSGEILDELAEATLPTAPEVQLARARANYRQWMAGKRNDAYAEKPAHMQLDVNIGSLHLDALRKRGHMDAVRKPTEIETADYQLLEEGKDAEDH